MARLKPWLSNVIGRMPLLRRLAPLGWKYVLVEALLEIPFLLLEFTIWFGPLFGVTIGLSLWQCVLLAIVLYLLVEGGASLSSLRCSNGSTVF